MCIKERERERDSERERERERERGAQSKHKDSKNVYTALCSMLCSIYALCSMLCALFWLSCPVSQSVSVTPVLWDLFCCAVLLLCSALLCSALLCSAALFFHLKCQNLMVWHFKWQGTGLLSSTIDKFSQAAIAFISSLAGDVASSNDFGCNCLADLKVR